MQLLSSCTLAEIWRWREALDVLEAMLPGDTTLESYPRSALYVYPLNWLDVQELLVK